MSDIIEYTYNMLKERYEDKKYERVIEVFEDNGELHSHEKSIKLYLWALYLNSGTEEKCTKQLNKYLELFPSESLWLLGGHVYKFLGKKNRDLVSLIVAQALYGNLEDDYQKYLQEIEEIREEIKLEKITNELKISSEQKAETDNEVEDIEEDNQTYKFESSISRGGNAFFPETIYVNSSEVTWVKKINLFKKEIKSIPISKIKSVNLTITLLGTEIIVKSGKHGIIHAKNFTKSDAQKIKSLLI